MTSQDERWREEVRAALRRSDGAPSTPSEGVASRAVRAGTERLVVRARTRTAVLGLAFAACAAACALAWSDVEAARTAEASVRRDVPWIP